MTHLNTEDQIEQLLEEDKLNPPPVEWSEDFPEPEYYGLLYSNRQLDFSEVARRIDYWREKMPSDRASSALKLLAKAILKELGVAERESRKM